MKMENYVENIYSLGETVPGQTQAMSQAVRKTLENNGGVGIMTGSWLIVKSSWTLEEKSP